MLTVLSSFAEEESRNVSENVKWRFKDKFKKGIVVVNTKRFLGYDKDEYGDLVINQEEAEIVKRIYFEYLNGNGMHRIAKLLNEEEIPTVTGVRWNISSIRDILKNEKYKGDAILQKTFTVSYLTKKKKKNNGELDSYYISENHSPIVSKEDWDQVQIEVKKRAESKGNFSDADKYKSKYPLSGMLICGKCGATLRRRTWNSKHSCKKIVWQCSNYILNGKEACEGIKIDDSVVSNVNIKDPTIVKEENKNGKKYYSYTSKSKQDGAFGNVGTTEKENGGILPGINGPVRTVIKL
jgi:hypothetical protein